MKKILILLLMLILGIVSYAKADDILGTWLIKENGKIVEIYKNENGKYTGKIKEDNFIFLEQNNDLNYFNLKFPEDKFSWYVWINIEKEWKSLYQRDRKYWSLENMLENYILLDKNNFLLRGE